MGTLQQELADHGLVSDPHDRCDWDCTVKGTGKKKYATEEAALAFQQRHVAKYGPQYPYLCTAAVTRDNPAHWHLTSKPAYVPGVKVESVEPKPIEPVGPDPPVSPVKKTKVVPATNKTMDLLDGTKTAQEIVDIVGGDRQRIYRIAKDHQLPYKKHPYKIPKPVQRIPILYERNELEILKAKRAELDKQIFTLSMPNIELLDVGAEISLNGAKTVLNEDQCRWLVEQTQKLNRYLR
jgi:hypothetical protein